MAEPEAQGQDEERYGVLLYYKYIDIPDLDELVAFYESNCNSLGLLGRVRLSPNGVNVTVCSTPPLHFPFVSRENAKIQFSGLIFLFQNGDVK
jgi:predicted sulfurtransferase